MNPCQISRLPAAYGRPQHYRGIDAVNGWTAPTPCHRRMFGLSPPAVLAGAEAGDCFRRSVCRQ